MRYPLRRKCHIFGRSWGGGTSPLTIKKTNFWVLMDTFTKLNKQSNSLSILKKIIN